MSTITETPHLYTVEHFGMFAGFPEWSTNLGCGFKVTARPHGSSSPSLSVYHNDKFLDSTYVIDGGREFNPKRVQIAADRVNEIVRRKFDSLVAEDLKILHEENAKLRQEMDALKESRK